VRQVCAASSLGLFNRYYLYAKVQKVKDGIILDQMLSDGTYLRRHQALLIALSLNQTPVAASMMILFSEMSR
jgi:hypothetical protein